MKRDLRYGGSTCDERELKAIINSAARSIESGNWQAGEEAQLLEKEAAKSLGVNYGTLTTSGSSAGLLALSALELPKGSSVLIPAVTFPTIFNIILQCGLTPVVLDSKVGTYNLDPDELERAITKKTKAIIVVHALGNPVDMLKVMKIAKKYKLYVIEDNCDGWGTTLAGKKIGSFGDVSFTSFHAAHIVSMGVGGGVFTNNQELSKKVRMYRDWGRQADINESKNTKHKDLPEDYNPRFIYEKVGYNFQILELQAAMGRVQLKKADQIKKLRQKNFNYLYKHLAKFGDLVLPNWNKKADVCWFSFPLSVVNDRGSLLRHLEEHGIETRPMFAGRIDLHPAYAHLKIRKGGKLKHSTWILSHSFWITCHPRLTHDDLKYIVSVFEKYYERETSSPRVSKGISREKQRTNTSLPTKKKSNK